MLYLKWINFCVDFFSRIEILEFSRGQNFVNRGVLKILRGQNFAKRVFLSYIVWEIANFFNLYFHVENQGTAMKY